MNCPKCKITIPDDSDFCQYCGINISENNIDIGMNANNQGATNAASDPSLEKPKEVYHSDSIDSIDNTDVPHKHSNVGAEIHIFDRKGSVKRHNTGTIRFCQKCGGTIDNDSRKCMSCGRQYFKVKTVLPVIMLAIMVISLAGLNAYQFIMSHETTAVVEDLKDAVSQKDDIIISQEQMITSQSESIDSYKSIIDYYENTTTSLRSEIDSLNAKNADLIGRIIDKSNIIDFYEEFAVVVPDDGSNLFHTYGCDDLGFSDFWIYNRQAALDLGYEPCPYCQ